MLSDRERDVRDNLVEDETFLRSSRCWKGVIWDGRRRAR